MKLYTEEQVINALKLAHSHITSLQNIIDRLKPIEVPSDEEIDKEAFQVPYDNVSGFYDLQFIKGANWMRDKIQRGNK